MDNIVCGRCSVRQITQIRRCIFFLNINIFRHLKLEIVLAIPASYDEKYSRGRVKNGQLFSCLCMSTEYKSPVMLKTQSLKELIRE